MDPLSFLGIALGLVAIIGGNWLEGGHIESLTNGPALVIVLGGTIGAMLLQTPVATFFRAMRMVGSVFMPPRKSLVMAIEKIVLWSNTARKEGLLGLENVAEQEDDLFVRKAVELVVDGNEPDEIRHTLEVELDTREQRDVQAAKVFEAMGGYAPTIGIIGAVMGLIHVMQNLADPSRLGSGIATAFVATIYGVGLSNLLFLPLANKLKAHARATAMYHELVIEGLVAIADGDNPRNIETRLQGYLR